MRMARLRCVSLLGLLRADCLNLFWGPLSERSMQIWLRAKGLELEHGDVCPACFTKFSVR